MKKIIFLFLITFSVMYADAPNTCDVLAAEPGSKSNLPGVVGVKTDKIDSIKAIEACTQAVKDFPNEPRYGYQLARAYFSNKNYKEGAEWYAKSAEQGHADAQYTMGMLYRWGAEVEKDDKKAFKWFMKAAEQGHADAQEKIGDIYYEGLGINKDYKKSFKWYMKAAEQGNADAQFSIGWMHYHGQGVKWEARNHEKAFKWFMKAAEQGHADAQYKIGHMFYNWEAKTKDFEKAFNWYMKAAEQGHADAQERIGVMYTFELGVDKNYEEAFKWLMKSAEQNNTGAMNSIAFLHTMGWGVRKNYKKSFEWNMKAAKLGNSHAQLNIGDAYREGHGVKKNYIKAYSWTSLALLSITFEPYRERVLESLDELEKKMTPEQINIAQSYNPLREDKEVENTPDGEKTEYSQRYTGTGFFVDKSTVLTNHHVVKSCVGIELVRNGYKSNAKIKARDSINDLVILEAETPNGNSLNFRAGKGIRIGEDIIVIGYPMGYLLGSGIKLTTGNVSALTGLVNDTTRMQLTAPVQKGNSGGALLDTSGNVVGVIVSQLKKGQNVNLAIKSNVAQMFLDINNVDYGVALSKNKKDVADIADEAKESIVQVICYQ